MGFMFYISLFDKLIFYFHCPFCEKHLMKAVFDSPSHEIPVISDAVLLTLHSLHHLDPADSGLRVPSRAPTQFERCPLPLCSSVFRSSSVLKDISATLVEVALRWGKMFLFHSARSVIMNTFSLFI